VKLNLPKHWDDFLEAVDKALEEPVCLHCIGGFVVETVYGIPRRTGDLDYCAVHPRDAAKTLEEIAGQKSELAKNHSLYFQYVNIVSKLTRNLERDRDDVKALAVVQKLSFGVLKKRCQEEMDWLPNRAQHDRTLELWEEYFPN